MDGSGDEGIGVTNELSRLDEACGFDGWPAGCAGVLAEHNSEFLYDRAGLDWAVGGEVLALRRVCSAGESQLAYEHGFHNLWRLLPLVS